MKWSALYSILFSLWTGISLVQTNPVYPSYNPGVALQDTVRIKNYIAAASRYMEKSNYDSADYYAGKALDLSRSDFYRPGKAASQFILGQSAFNSDRLLISIRYYFGALNEFDMMRDSLQMALTHVNIGKIYRHAGLYGKAIEYFVAADTLYASLKATSHSSDLLYEKANCYFDLEDYQQAENDYNKILKMLPDDKGSELYIEIINRLILCYHFTGRYEEALTLTGRLLELSRAKGDLRQEFAALNNLGFMYKKMNNYEEALRYFDESITLERLKDPDGMVNPVILLNKAIIQQNTGDYQGAGTTLLEAIHGAERSGEQKELAHLYHLYSAIYFQEKDLYNALVYNNKAMILAKEQNEQELLLQVYHLAYRIDEALYNFESSFLHYKKYLDIKDSLDRVARRQEEELIRQQFLVERAEKEIGQMLGNQEINDLEVIQLRLETTTRQQQMEILQKNDSLQKITIQNQELEKNRALQDLILAEERLAAERKDREIVDLKQREEIQALELQKKELQQQQSQQEIALLTKDKKLNELALSKARARNYFMFGISVLALAVLYAVYRGLRFAHRANRTLARQNIEINRQKDEINQNLIVIDEERKKSDKLLLNILPAETANELKEKGFSMPRHYDMVSILFTDFVGFTFVAERMTPDELIAELNHCFLEFDRIIDRHGVEKIKTIGDSYMCAGGIPIPNTTNPVDVVSAALEIAAFVTRTRQERLTAGKDYWEVRIGVNTGAVMAGVVGKNKFAYDIWGDAVNTASRMESSGKSGMVNISGATYQLVKDHFNCSYRGKVQAKNKGEVDMYFVDKIKEQRAKLKDQK